MVLLEATAREDGAITDVEDELLGTDVEDELLGPLAELGEEDTVLLLLVPPADDVVAVDVPAEDAEEEGRTSDDDV